MAKKMIKTLFKTCGKVAKIADGHYFYVIFVFGLLHILVTILIKLIEMIIFWSYTSD